MLSFQERVLEEAEDPDNPLLERVKFLSIFSSNLAEFYMVRIAGLKQQVQAGVRELSADGLTPAEQLAIVRESARQLIMRGRGLYSPAARRTGRERHLRARLRRARRTPARATPTATSTTSSTRC